MELSSVSEFPTLRYDPYDVVMVCSGGDSSTSFTDSLYTEFKKLNLKAFSASDRRRFIREAVAQAKRSNTGEAVAQAKRYSTESVVAQAKRCSTREAMAQGKRSSIIEAIAQGKRYSTELVGILAKRSSTGEAVAQASTELVGKILKSFSTAVAILENDLAKSSRCLDALLDILESHGQKKTVLPVFYNVDPSDVRNQTGSFAEAFARHEETYKDDPDKVRRWRAALTQVASYTGWDSRGRQEPELIKEIVDDIWRKLHPTAKTSTPYSSPYSSPYPSQRWRYNVFMSFRGTDTRLNVVGHMYDSLEQKGITTFKDDKKLERGVSLSSGIVKAIDESQIFLVTLSEDFASSTWCLDELVEILECTETSNLQTIREAFRENEEAKADMAGIKCNTRDRKVSKVRISVHYDGDWVNTAYIGGKAEQIVVSKDITCEELLGIVYRIVGIDRGKYEIIMKTTDESKSPAQPVQIVNDEDLAFFIEQSLSLDKSSKTNVPNPRISSGTKRKRNELGVLLNYDGKWANSIYSGGKTKVIMVSDSITYEELVPRLHNILEVDPRKYKIMIRTAYASTLPTQPVELTHDGDLRFFIDMNLDKGSNIPLCITRQRQYNRWNHLFSSLFARWVS